MCRTTLNEALRLEHQRLRTVSEKVVETKVNTIITTNYSVILAKTGKRLSIRGPKIGRGLIETQQLYLQIGQGNKRSTPRVTTLAKTLTMAVYLANEIRRLHHDFAGGAEREAEHQGNTYHGQ
jgi:hypothetical protein